MGAYTEPTTTKKYTVSVEETSAPNGYNPKGKIEFEVVSILKDNKSIVEVESPKQGNNKEAVDDVIYKLDYYEFNGIDKGFIFKMAN